MRAADTVLDEVIKSTTGSRFPVVVFLARPARPKWILTTWNRGSWRSQHVRYDERVK